MFKRSKPAISCNTAKDLNIEKNKTTPFIIRTVFFYLELDNSGRLAPLTCVILIFEYIQTYQSISERQIEKQIKICKTGNSDKCVNFLQGCETGLAPLVSCLHVHPSRVKSNLIIRIIGRQIYPG